MPSFVTTDIIRYNNPSTPKYLKSHVLHPHNDITILCIVGSAKENVTSVVEDHLLETISSTEWRHGEEDNDFSYVTEKYNRFLSNLATADEETVSVIFAVERDGHLMVSSIGESEVILQEDDASASSIHEDTRGHHRFELISSGEIPVNSSVFIVSRSIDGILGETFYADSAKEDSSAFAEMAKEILHRDVGETTHMIRIRRSRPVLEKTKLGRNENKALLALKEKLKLAGESLADSKKLRNIRQYSGEFFEKKQSTITIIFLVIGVILFFGLISQLLSALFSVSTSQTQDSKNQILEARSLLESSMKLTSNPTAFDATIRSTEAILADLDSKKLYTKDVQEIRDKIEAVKKELYDIQVVDLNGRPSLIPFDSTLIAPVGLYEREKKLYLIGKEEIIWDYGIGETALKTKEYPSGEVARDFASIEDGNVYILTESNRIIASRKSADISYVNVTGQEKWETADGISVFNGNIYLWNRSEGQVYRHRPGLNGFSQQSNVLDTATPGIVDIGIDGGFYVIKDDQKISRIISGKTQTGLTINKIPGEYTIGTKPDDTDLIVRPELNYIYIRDGNRVWIFLPDSKRFQDIRSWTYVAQIELSTQEVVKSIAVARDGLIYVLTEEGVYDVLFEFVDDNIILRS